MENRKCPALVDGKVCGLALILVKRELETETDVYECPLGHRKYVLSGEIEKRKCPALVDGKECGLAVTLVKRELETATASTNARWVIAHMSRSNQKPQTVLSHLLHPPVDGSEGSDRSIVQALQNGQVVGRF